MNICICMTESLCCTLEPSTTLQIKYTPTQFLKNQKKIENEKEKKRKKIVREKVIEMEPS